MLLLVGFFIYVKQSQLQKVLNAKGGADNASNSKLNNEEDLDENIDDDLNDLENFCSSSKSRKRNNRRRSVSRFDNEESLLSLDEEDRHGVLEKRKSYEMKRRNMECLFHSLSPKDNVCEELLETQYHKDYNDTITAINNLTPQKELFNMGFLPVKVINPDPQNVKELIRLFIRRVNEEVKNRVSEYLHVNSGWNDQGKQKKIKSGFEEQMEVLGLPGDLYTQPADKAKIRVVKIDKAEQHMTDDQIRFIIHVIVQKKNVKDQMVLKVQFFMEKEDLKTGGDHRDSFFAKSLVNQKENHGEENLDNVVIIEQVFTVGFLSDTGTSKTRMDKFHEYSDIMNQNGIIDQYKVLQIMKKKHADRSKELSSFLCSVDDETKELHDVPGIGDYQSYKNTRTIMDDLKINPQDSFGQIPM